MAKRIPISHDGDTRMLGMGVHLGLRDLGLALRFSSLRINSRAIKPMPTQMAESAILKAGQRKEET